MDQEKWIVLTCVGLLLIAVLPFTVWWIRSRKPPALSVQPSTKRAPYEQHAGRLKRDGKARSFDDEIEAQRTMLDGFDVHDALYEATVSEPETRPQAADRQAREQRLYGGKEPDDAT